MGGSGAGESASHLAIATLVSLVRYFGKWNLRVDDTIAQDIMARAERFYRYVHSTVANERHKDSTGTNQTTLTAVFSAGTDLFFAHIGHSRAYLLRHEYGQHGDAETRAERRHNVAGSHCDLLPSPDSRSVRADDGPVSPAGHRLGAAPVHTCHDIDQGNRTRLARARLELRRAWSQSPYHSGRNAIPPL